MTPFPAPNRLHVWWARPLVASRAAILASLLPDGVDRQAFLHVLGIHGDPIAARKKIAAARRDGGDIFDQAPDEPEPSPITITCKSADSLDHIQNASIDAVVMDPPYHDNVMYAELSDFFYVWLKRTAGHVFPELFTRQLTEQGERSRRQPGQVRRREGRPRLGRARLPGAHGGHLRCDGYSW